MKSCPGTPAVRVAGGHLAVLRTRTFASSPSLAQESSSANRRKFAAALLALSSAVALAGVEPSTPDPSSVVIAGSLQNEAGCTGDWNPACAATALGYIASDDVWQGTFAIPAGNWEYLAALNGSFVESYGQHGELGGANVQLTLPAPTAVKFYYSHHTHWVTDSESAVIAVVPGNFQSEIGCPGDWQPDCLRSWLQDLDGDGIYRLTAHGVAAGNYECKVAIDESWTESYGQGGVPGGANIPFVQPFADYEIDFAYDAVTHILSVTTSLFSDPFETGTLAAWSVSPP